MSRLLAARRARRPAPRWPVYLLAAAYACALPDASKSGDLGNGAFVYSCVGANGLDCPSGSTAGTFPSAIALGTPFDLKYNASSSDYLHVDVAPVSPQFFAITRPSTFTALRPGTLWLFAEIPNGQVLDTTSVTVAEIASIALNGASLPGYETVGHTDTFTATPLDSGNVTLAGDVAYAWATSDAHIASVIGNGPIVSVRFTSSGNVSLSVAAQGVQTSIVVSVIGGTGP